MYGLTYMYIQIQCTYMCVRCGICNHVLMVVFHLQMCTWTGRVGGHHWRYIQCYNSVCIFGILVYSIWCQIHDYALNNVILLAMNLLQTMFVLTCVCVYVCTIQLHSCGSAFCKFCRACTNCLTIMHSITTIISCSINVWLCYQVRPGSPKPRPSSLHLPRPLLAHPGRQKWPTLPMGHQEGEQLHTPLSLWCSLSDIDHSWELCLYLWLVGAASNALWTHW